MKNLIKYLPWVAVLIVSIMFVRQCNQDKVPTYIPFEVKVEVPVYKNTFDTIVLPAPLPKKIVEILFIMIGTSN